MWTTQEISAVCPALSATVTVRDDLMQSTTGGGGIMKLTRTCDVSEHPAAGQCAGSTTSGSAATQSNPARSQSESLAPARNGVWLHIQISPEVGETRQTAGVARGAKSAASAAEAAVSASATLTTQRTRFMTSPFPEGRAVGSDVRRGSTRRRGGGRSFGAHLLRRSWASPRHYFYLSMVILQLVSKSSATIRQRYTPDAADSPLSIIPPQYTEFRPGSL